MRSHSSTIRLHNGPSARRRRGQTRFRPIVELLEDRRLLATIEVTTFADVVADDGQTSLREAIAEVAALPGDDTIELPAGTYPLALGQITVDDASGSVTIESTGGVATIDGQFASRLLEVTAVSVVQLEGLALIQGFDPAGGNGGAILNAGALSIDGSSLNTNFSLGNGGAVANAGTLSIDDSAVTGNAALGAMGGGGIFNTGTATVQGTSLASNQGFRAPALPTAICWPFRTASSSAMSPSAAAAASSTPVRPASLTRCCRGIRTAASITRQAATWWLTTASSSPTPPAAAAESITTQAR